MKPESLNTDGCNRRAFAGYLAKSLLGVGLAPLTFQHNLAAASKPITEVSLRKAATKVIYLYMNGGMSHLDTLDPKKNEEVRGPVSSLIAPHCGIQVSEYLPRMAGLMHHTAVIRSMKSNQGAHERGRYYVWTGYNQRGTIRHPAMGAWAVRLGGVMNPNLPGYIKVGGDSRHPGSGFMEAKYAPLPIGNPERGLQNSGLPKGIDEDAFQNRLSMVDKFNRRFEESYQLKNVRAYSDAYEHAIKLMKSQDLAAFDLSLESEKTRAAYGEDAFGQGCLLARRLIERDVRFVDVSLGGWDTHQNNFERVPQRAEILDQAMSALIQDLASRGLLEETLVVLATEFGRTPKINQNNGRDHYPKAFSCMLAGGGVKGGTVHGATNAQGTDVESDPVSIPDFNATIAHAMGLPQDEIIYAPSGRPFTVADKGKPVTSIFA